jgi:hypothetical protein
MLMTLADSSTRVVFKQENDADDLILIGFEGMVSVSSGVFFRDIEVKAHQQGRGSPLSLLCPLWALAGFQTPNGNFRPI